MPMPPSCARPFSPYLSVEAHEMINNGASVGELADAYMQNLKEQFGDSVEVAMSSAGNGSLFLIFLMCRFMFMHTPLANYWFSPFTSNTRRKVNPLFRAIPRSCQPVGQKPRSRYWTEAGIDISDPAFWQGGFNVLIGLVEQLEAIPVA